MNTSDFDNNYKIVTSFYFILGWGQNTLKLSSPIYAIVDE